MCGSPRRNDDGARAVNSASSSPSRSMPTRVCSLPMGLRSSPAIGLSGVRSSRPASSWPPLRQWISVGSTPYSCCSMPRIHTTAVILYFWQATRLLPRAARAGRRDAGSGAQVDAGMPEQPRHEGGDADIGRVPRRHRADIARERKLRDVEFLVAEGAKEDLFRIKRQVGDLAACHLDTAVPDGACTVVVAARNGYRHLHHWGLLLGFALGWGGRKA